MTGNEIAEYISHQKAVSFKDELSDNEIVITADTIVWCNNKVLGKPVIMMMQYIFLGKFQEILMR